MQRFILLTHSKQLSGIGISYVDKSTIIIAISFLFLFVCLFYAIAKKQKKNPANTGYSHNLFATVEDSKY